MRFQCPTPFLTLAITPLRSASIAIWQVLRTAPYRHDRTVTAIHLNQGDSLNEAQLREFCGNYLAAHKIPRYIWFLDEPLPRNASGKFLKRELQERLAATVC